MWDAPEAAQEVELDDAGTVMMVEPEGTRVMPSRSTILAGALAAVWLKAAPSPITT